MRFTSVCQHFRSEHKLPTMTGFTDLPNELMVEVLDPEAVPNFAVTSKEIYALGSSFIKEHHELRARYSFIHTTAKIEWAVV